MDRDDYLSEVEAVYQGYDVDDDGETTYGFSVSRSGDDDAEWVDDEEDAQPCSDDDLSASARYEESWGDVDEPRDSYTINGREYKDPRQYIRVLYRVEKDMAATIERYFEWKYDVPGGKHCPWAGEWERQYMTQRDAEHGIIRLPDFSAMPWMKSLRRMGFL